ncbi:MAG TPA: M48 family metallopeptidase [Polyangiaceae bacterium]|nr:M48 family metallopeptidase [Polyangiaceae bacterium]
MKAAALLVLLAIAAARLWLSWLNLRYLQREGHRVPPVLEGEVDAGRLGKISDYTAQRARFGLLHGALSTLVTALFLFAGGLGWYDQLVAGAVDSFVGQSVVFVLGLLLTGALLEIPFGLYGTFRIEAEHGFNRQTLGLWWSDWLKSTLLSLVLTGALAAGAFALVQVAPSTWWLWVSALIAGVSLLLTFASPYVIEPLFHKMEPLEVEGLSDGIRSMTERAGVHVGRVLKVDASRRSSHSNAYFTGLGRVKRVVLFDTLLTQMSHAQILAVLAHELGHWKKHHVLFRMLVMLALLVLGAHVAFLVLPTSLLPALVGLESASFAARLVILMVAASALMFPLTPLFAAWSRHDERQADAFAIELHGHARDLADALAKLGMENLSNLHPHPLYAAFYYSHPPLAERIGNLTGNNVKRCPEQ